MASPSPLAPLASLTPLVPLGIVRPAKRPPGWVPPGPRPRTPDNRPELWPGPGEDLCYLSGDFRILQRLDGHRWSVDDLITAWYAITRVAATPPRRIIDLGCGIGTVLLFTTWRFPQASSTGIEAQELSAGMAARSVAWNGVDDRCQVRHADLRDRDARADLGPADLVTGTPPYLPKGTGLESEHDQRGACRFEYRGGIEDYCLAAAELLAPDAPFVACFDARGRTRVEKAAANAGLAIQSYRDIIPKEGKPPLFSVFSASRGEKVAALVDEPPICIRDRQGRFTDEFGAICREMGMPV